MRSHRVGGSVRSRLGQAPKQLPIENVERLPQLGPDCPRCSAVMVLRDGPHSSFWGCRNYPRCTKTLPLA